MPGSNPFEDLPDAPKSADIAAGGMGEPTKLTTRPPPIATAEPSSNPFDALPDAPKSRGAAAYVDDAVRALAQGATFGFADELAAAGNTLPIVGTGKSYAENLAAEKARNEQIPTAIQIPGEIAGAVGTTIATAPASAAVATATGIAKLPGIVRSILAGGTAGALFGAGNAEPGLAPRLEGAGSGAAIGAVAGGVVHPLVSSLGAAVSSLRNVASPRTQVAAELGRALTRDNIAPADLAAAAAGAQTTRPGVAALADVGGENVRGLVERVAQTPGAGRDLVTKALTSRQQQQAARLSMDLASLTGTRQSAIEATNQTMAQRAAAAEPLYKEAMNFNAREVPAIVRAFDETTATGYGRDVLRSKEFRNNLQTEYGITDPTDAPLMVVIDAFKKAANDLQGSAARAGSNNSARVIKNMTDKLVATVDEHNPAYATARAAWAGPTQYLEAIQEGAKLASPKLGADEVRSALADMSGANREAYVTGALSSIFRRMGNDPAKLVDTTKYLRSPEMRDKVAALMPTPEAAAQWGKRLDFEIRASELTGQALGNSRTAVRQAEQEQASNIAIDLLMHTTAGAPPLAFLRKAVGMIPKPVYDTLRSRNDLALGEILTNPLAASPDALRKVIDAAQVQMNRGRLPLLTSTAPANAATATYESNPAPAAGGL